MGQQRNRSRQDLGRCGDFQTWKQFASAKFSMHIVFRLRLGSKVLHASLHMQTLRSLITECGGPSITSVFSGAC